MALKRSVLYDEVKAHPAWGDFMNTVSRMRGGIREDILRGTVDKFGATHDDAKRSVFYVLTALLTLPDTIKTDADALRRQADDLARRAKAEGPLHGKDILGNPLDEL